MQNSDTAIIPAPEDARDPDLDSTLDSGSVKGRVHSVETLGALDGPGLRYVLFLQGCPFRCAYCHNPDTRDFESGYEVTVRELLEEILRYRNYLSGGLTVSGGEPLLQAEFVSELLEKCRERGIHGAIDTSGGMSLPAIKRAVRAADLILLDMKAFDRLKAVNLCGVDTDRTWELLDFCEKIGKPVWIRHVLIPGITVFEKDEYGNSFVKREDFLVANEELSSGILRLERYSCIHKIDLLPFHKMGEHKWTEMNLSFPLRDIDEPDEHVIAWCESLIRCGSSGGEEA